MEDQRIAQAREWMAEEDSGIDPVFVITDLLDYAGERLKVNVGLIAEITGLKQKIGAPQTLDLSNIPTADLLAELAHRLEDG